MSTQSTAEELRALERALRSDAARFASPLEVADQVAAIIVADEERTSAGDPGLEPLDQRSVVALVEAVRAATGEEKPEATVTRAEAFRAFLRGEGAPQ